MFSVRIHSLESSPPELAGDPLEDPGTSRNPDSRLHVFRGVLHLYRNSSSPPSFSSSPSSSTPPPLPPSPNSLLPAGRGTLLLILAVPGRLLPEDFTRFCGSYIERATCIRVIRNDAIEDRYSVLVEFDDQKTADGFYLDVNGWRFTTEGEVCHILFIGSVEYTESTDIAGTAPTGSTELPTCPVCIERLDQEISGIFATTCDHSFQCSCISKWVNSSCSVCQFCQKHSDKPKCSVCDTSENLWICVICGFVGCGRYKEGHAIRHWKDTQHSYSLDLETQRIWDYVGDSYVHRLNQSRSDDKLDKLKSNNRSLDENCIGCGCSDESGMGETLLNSKIEAVKDEYNRLLASQLESQKQYYETLVQEEKDKKEQYVSEDVEKAVNLKMQDIQLQIGEANREIKIITDINKKLVKDQNLWREKIKETEERERATLKMKNEKIRDLEEQIRDFTVFIETQRKLSMADAHGIRGGTVLPIPASLSPSGNAKRSTKTSRRRN